MSSTFILIALFAVVIFAAVKLPRLRERGKTARSRTLLALHGTMSFDSLAAKTAAALREELARTLPGQPGPNLVDVFVGRLDWAGLPEHVKNNLGALLTDLVLGKLNDDELLVPSNLVVRVFVDDGVHPHRPSFRMSAVSRVAAGHSARQRTPVSVTDTRQSHGSGHPTVVMSDGKRTVSLGHPTAQDPVRSPDLTSGLPDEPEGRRTERLIAITVYVEGRAVTDIELKEGTHVIGRERCAVRIPHGTVSARHSVLTVTREQATVRNLSRTNGTSLKRLGPVDDHRPTRLLDGDIIYLSASVWLLVVRGGGQQ